MKTIKQIADDLGVSKTAVRKKIENLGLWSDLQKNGNQFLVNNEQEKLIKSAFSKAEAKPNSQIDTETISTLVSMLQAELEAKNKQIEELNARLAEVSAALVAAQQTAAAAQALHAGTIHQQLFVGNDGVEQLEQENLEPVVAEEKHWWKFWK